MTADSDPDGLVSILGRMCDAADDSRESVSVGKLMSHVGQRSFGPLLLVPALIAFTPLGGIPGVPTALAIFIIGIAGQLLVGMKHFWLPQAVLRRSIQRSKLETSVRYLQPVARFIDKLLRPRIVALTREPFVHLAALLCVLVALSVPPLEVVPFGGTASWAAIAAFGLSLIAKDGLLMLIALGFSLGAGYILFVTLF